MISRRRMISILAGGAALPLLGSAAFGEVKSWQGVALGANAKIILNHPDADALIELALKEVSRLENIFSLYKSGSEISQLNALGTLTAPSIEFVELLNLSDQINRVTNGVFDPTVQPLWALYAEETSAGRSPTAAQISNVRESTGWQHLSFSLDEIRFKKNVMALTLNGIAQGFIADKVAALLRKNGVKNVLVNTGEINALGYAPDGQAWGVGIANKPEKIALSNQAIATSAPSGTLFGNGNVGHILNPLTGGAEARWDQLSVIDKSAAKADGLSTAFCLMTKEQILNVDGAHQILFGAPVST